MAQWTHNICSVCWGKQHADREPCKILTMIAETCCFCGRLNTDGIFTRYNPKLLKFCKCEED